MHVCDLQWYNLDGTYNVISRVQHVCIRPLIIHFEEYAEMSHAMPETFFLGVSSDSFTARQPVR